ncbi:flagellar biosynthesis protein FlhA [Oligoflexia bacterium]|nr:flagellar biosynthesis protein FlhA [Oligoflexia bacterium]
MIKDLCVPVGVILILISMLLPLPPYVIDFLLVGNLILALILLISTLYISEPLKLSALPTILLLATLYRLALNISTTRLILGSGEVGQVIEAFGNVVIQGNIVVGVVVFLVITLVQFIVIAKGSERVAEVSARFTLDALPGKQMSIDADVRAGLIDFQTARQKRQDLQTESRFYGALDGAMKFVKGDAIASIIITAINIIGGFSIGVLLNGLEMQSALSRYTLFTVGDGLLSQIPALLNSIAAGMIVTRVVRGDNSSLATELVEQLGQLQRVKVMVGTVAMLFAMVPALPSLPFLFLGGVLFLSAFMANQKANTEGTRQPRTFSPRTPAVIAIELPESSWVDLMGSGQALEMLRVFKEETYERKGLVLLQPELIVAHELDRDFKVKMRGVVFTSGRIPAEVDTLIDTLAALLKQLVEERCCEFVDDILTRRTLDFFDEEAPELVSAVVPGVVTLTQLTGVLKELAREGLPIRNFDMILQAVAESGPKANGERELLEDVRIALRRMISEKYANEQRELTAYTLDPLIDLGFVKAEKEEGALDLTHLALMVDTLTASEMERPLLLASKGARRLIQECMDLRKIDAIVLAHDELTSEAQLVEQGNIALKDNERVLNVIDAIAA